MQVTLHKNRHHSPLDAGGLFFWITCWTESVKSHKTMSGCPCEKHVIGTIRHGFIWFDSQHRKSEIIHVRPHARISFWPVLRRKSPLIFCADVYFLWGNLQTEDGHELMQGRSDLQTSHGEHSSAISATDAAMNFHSTLRSPQSTTEECIA